MNLDCVYESMSHFVIIWGTIMEVMGYLSEAIPKIWESLHFHQTLIFDIQVPFKWFHKWVFHHWSYSEDPRIWCGVFGAFKWIIVLWRSSHLSVLLLLEIYHISKSYKSLSYHPSLFSCPWINPWSVWWCVSCAGL